MKSVHNYLKSHFHIFPYLLKDFGKIHESTISPEVSCLVLHIQVYREERRRDFSFVVRRQQAKPYF